MGGEIPATIDLVIYNNAPSGVITGWSVYDEQAESVDGKKYAKFTSKTPLTYLYPGKKAFWKVQLPATMQAANIVLEYENGNGPRMGVAKLSFLSSLAGIEVLDISPDGALSVRNYRPRPTTLPLSRGGSVSVQELAYQKT